MLVCDAYFFKYVQVYMIFKGVCLQINVHVQSPKILCSMYFFIFATLSASDLSFLSVSKVFVSLITE